MRIFAEPAQRPVSGPGIQPGNLGIRECSWTCPDTSPRRIHAPDEKADMALLLKGAETAAYRWDELAAAATELMAAR
ncbi:MAG TPA: hypothetical protein VMK13_13375 [Streptosporangiaceae bacterium]|nr:hypothetical protein [Streptosporangiaceae bacterium]